jgi:hypothetical protein
MKYRVLSLLLLFAALAVFLGTPLVAQEKGKDTHIGTFVSGKGKEFTMSVKKQEHSHTLAAGAKVIGPEGKEIHLEDLKKGQLIRVTTEPDNIKIATKVEALKKKKKE